MWHLHQSTAWLDAVSPASSSAQSAPSLPGQHSESSSDSRVHARLDCRDPGQGIIDWQIASSEQRESTANAASGDRWQVLPSTVSTMRFVGPLPTEVNSRLSEAYVRGVDLVVEYGENADGDRCELYYRALLPPTRGAPPSAVRNHRAPGDATSSTAPELRLRTHDSGQHDSQSGSQPGGTRDATVAGTIDGVFGGVELWASVQTRRLDSRPQIEVGNRFPAGTEVLAVPNWPYPGLRVFRLPGIQVSYVESVHPADVAIDAANADVGGSAIPSVNAKGEHAGGRANELRGTVEWWTGLNVVWMEKGVIRRCRVRGWWVARERDLAIAAELTLAFLADAPPLTA